MLLGLWVCLKLSWREMRQEQPNAHMGGLHRNEFPDIEIRGPIYRDGNGLVVSLC